MNDNKKKQKKRDEWQISVIMLAMEYQQLLNTDLRYHIIAGLPPRVGGILEKLWDPIDIPNKEIMFYVGGAVLPMISKMGNRSNDRYYIIITGIQSNSLTGKEAAREDNLYC